MSRYYLQFREFLMDIEKAIMSILKFAQNMQFVVIPLKTLMIKTLCVRSCWLIIKHFLFSEPQLDYIL